MDFSDLPFVKAVFCRGQPPEIGKSDEECHLYMSSVEWHMQLMHWLPGKWRATEASRAAWYSADMAGPPTMPTVDWQSTLTPSMPAPALAGTDHQQQQDRAFLSMD